MTFDRSRGDIKNYLPPLKMEELGFGLEHQALCHSHDFTCHGPDNFLILVCALKYTRFIQSETSVPCGDVDIEASQYFWDLPFIS